MKMTIDIPESDMEKLKIIIDQDEDEDAIQEAITYTIDNY